MQLYNFQSEILKDSHCLNRVAYYLDMGLGKTFIGAEKLRQLNAPYNLVVCQKSKLEDWKEHFRKYYDFEIFDLAEKKEFSIFAERLKANNGGLVGVINYDILWKRGLEKLLYGKAYTLLLDESSLIQNIGAIRTKFVVYNLKPKNVILLSGTPVGGKYENLYSQLFLLGLRQKYRDFFIKFVKYKTIKANGREVLVPYGYKNEKQLKELMQSLGCFFMKTEEVLELPKQNFIEVNLKKPKGYDELVNKPLGKGDKAEFGRMVELRQISGDNDLKEGALLDLLCSSQSRFIVFYCFNKELARIIDVCRFLKRPVSIVNGEVKDLEFYETREDSITLVQYQSGAMGLNLQKANKVIFYSPTFRSELYEQAKKRIHRIGQERTCFYYHLKSGFDYAVYKVLEKRQDYTNKLFIKEFKYEKD